VPARLITAADTSPALGLLVASDLPCKQTFFILSGGGSWLQDQQILHPTFIMFYPVCPNFTRENVIYT
jgi:hypothetical protein